MTGTQAAQRFADLGAALMQSASVTMRIMNFSQQTRLGIVAKAAGILPGLCLFLGEFRPLEVQFGLFCTANNGSVASKRLLCLLLCSGLIIG